MCGALPPTLKDIGGRGVGTSDWPVEVMLQNSFRKQSCSRAVVFYSMFWQEGLQELCSGGRLPPRHSEWWASST